MLVPMLALVSAACLGPQYSRPADGSPVVDATTIFAQQIDAYLLHRRATEATVFSPAVAAMFRARISAVLRCRDVQQWLSDKTDQDEDDPVELRDVHANERFPEGVTHGFPVLLLFCLPPLPEPLEYRIVDRQLIILDVDLDVVVDVLPGAFGTVHTTGR